MITAIALALAVPLGLGAAMYLSEYASKKTRKRLKPIVELLAGVPSVVYGFFALSFVTPNLLQEVLRIDVGFTNALSAGLVLGVMIIPTIASLSEDAMSAVPLALRQGSFAMGANRMQTTLARGLPRRDVRHCRGCRPRAVPSSGRDDDRHSRGGVRPNLTLDPREGMQTMTGYIATTAGGENPVGSTSYNTLFAVGLLLFAITLVINIISISLVRRYRQEY